MTPDTTWKVRQKIAFRFSFLFLGISTIVPWHLIIYFAKSIFVKNRDYDFAHIYTFLSKPLYWLDKYIFHTGYDPKIHLALPGDNRYGVVFYLALFVVTIIGTIAWSILDKNRSDYHKLSYWFNVYLRYVLAMVLFGYGMDKLIPIQMAYPSVVDLLTPLGEQNKFSVLWNFMGISPGFQMFTGTCEILGSLLLLSRRTTLAGYLLLLIVLINVVAFNFFYNVPVKLFSSLLLVYLLYLISPFFYLLTQIFFYKRSVLFTDHYYGFEANRKRYALLLIMIIFPFCVFLFTTIGDVRRYNKDLVNAKREKLYEVVSFISKDTLPPLITDTIRWKRLLFAYTNSVVVCNMKDEKIWYTCDEDSVNKTFTLRDDGDTSAKFVFHYVYPTKDQLNLTGRWKGNDVTILMKSMPIDSMALKKEKIVLIQD